jgi:hypothetical protein
MFRVAVIGIPDWDDPPLSFEAFDAAVNHARGVIAQVMDTAPDAQVKNLRA